MSEQLQSSEMNVEELDFLAKEISENNVRNSYKRIGLITFFAAICILLIHLSPLKDYLAEIQELQAVVADEGYFAIFIFAGVTIVATFLGVPKLMFYTLAGLLFGFIRGLFVAQLSALLGAYGPFMFSRWVAGEWLLSRLDKYEQLKKRLQHPTILDVFLCRQLPIWGAMVSILLGTTKVSHSRFLLGSCIGFLPQGVIFTLLGSGFAAESMLQAVSRLWAALSFVLIGGLVTLWLVRTVKDFVVGPRLK
jgi:uncharacterized membrane protein YdjX (TVP38/TMEM64 family)